MMRKPKYEIGDIVTVGPTLARVITITYTDNIPDYLVIPCDGTTYLGGDNIPDSKELSGWYLETELNGGK